MLSVRSIFIAVAIFGFGPLSLAAPSMTNEESIVQHEQRDNSNAPLDQRDRNGVPEASAPGIATAGCFVTSKKGKDCHANACPATEQCKINDKGNCVYKNKKKDRPFGCEQCSCKKHP